MGYGLRQIIIAIGCGIMLALSNKWAYEYYNYYDAYTYINGVLHTTQQLTNIGSTALTVLIVAIALTAVCGVTCCILGCVFLRRATQEPKVIAMPTV